MIQCASAALGLTPVYIHPKKSDENHSLVTEAFADAEVVFARADKVKDFEELARSTGHPDLPVIFAPRLHFSGFHPDVVTPAKAAGKLPLPMGNANSAILLAAWRAELTEGEALTLFREEVFEALGYYEAFGLASELLAEECRRAALDVQPLMERWMEDAPFFYLPLHPNITVLRDIALTQLRNANLYGGSAAPAVEDPFSSNFIWPVYPEIGERLGIPGDYIFRPRNWQRKDRRTIAPMDLETFIARTFAAYRSSPPDLSSFPRLADPRLDSLRRFVKRRQIEASFNPYKQLPPSNWWAQAVAEPPVEEVDPITAAKFTIGRKDKVATAGSCFAQHIARRLESAGFNYLVTESAPQDCRDPAAEGYGTFTARFGNIYTVRQLLQLAERAYGRFEPIIDAWELAGGAGYVDPFRPRIGGKPFASPEALRASREVHFAAVREMFETADVFVFTLGLTECWRSRKDHAVVPLPPGVVGAQLHADSYEPKNFTVVEVLNDLQLLLDLFQRVNRMVRIILTVSPVPLIATFEKEHVLAAATYSKAVLRAAAGEIAKNNGHVAYFPSYEIITGSFTRGRYFADDLREVTSAGVEHVMRSFLRHYAAKDASMGPSPQAHAERFRSEAAAAMEVICDEEEIEASVGLWASEA